MICQSFVSITRNILLTAMALIPMPAECAQPANIGALGTDAASTPGYWVMDQNGNYSWDGTPTDGYYLWTTGQPGEVPVVGDWNGDGRTKMGVCHDGTWLLDYNGNGVWDGPDVDKLAFIGGVGYVPVVGDWNGTGNSKIGAYNTGSGIFLIDYNGNFAWDGTSVDRSVYWSDGNTGNIPVIGDWNGTGYSKIGVFYQGLWVLDYDGNYAWNPPVDKAFVWTNVNSGGVPVVGNWNGLWNTAKIGVYDSGYWVVDYDGSFTWDQQADKTAFYGGTEFVPVVGDWNGDGKSKIAAYSIVPPSAGAWVIDVNGNYTWDPPADVVTSFGGADQIPVVGKWTNQYSLMTTINPPGAGTVALNPPGGWYSPGTQVTLIATPNPGYQFTRFSGTFNSVSNPLTVTMNSAMTETATFAPNTTQYQLTTAVSPSAGGSITLTPSGGWYNSGASVTMTATTAAGYVFLGFSGALSGTTNPQSLSMVGPASVTANFTNTLTSTNLTDFQSCIGSSGVVTNCVLAQNRYAVDVPLQIGRSGITIAGGGGPGDTTLYRGNRNLIQIMVAGAGVTNVSIQNLTFDGNRYGFGVSSSGLKCLDGNSAYYDLNLYSGGTFWLLWLDFINAPGTALVLNGYGSVVALSNFGQGGYGVAPDGALRNETAQESATRSTAVFIEGDSNAARFNAISYAGTAAINLSGSNQIAYGNLLYQNRYEMSDLIGGGQLYLNPNSSAAIVSGNVIDGNFWPQYDSNGIPVHNPDTGCSLPQIPQASSGVEAYGFGHYFLNNEIENHTGTGMQFAGSQPTGRITISSENTADSTDPPRYIEMNQFNGILFLGPHFSSWPVTAQGLTLYKVNVRNNAGWDVVLDGISNDYTLGYYGQYLGFLNGSCIIVSNNFGPVRYSTSPPPYENALTHPVPTNFGAYTSNGGTCPDPGWPAQTPARSNIPGWQW